MYISELYKKDFFKEILGLLAWTQMQMTETE